MIRAKYFFLLICWLPGSVFRVVLVFSLIFFGVPSLQAQTTNSVPAQAATGAPAKRVLMIFSEARDLPGNVMLEQSARAEMLANSTNPVEFFEESMDASRFPNARHYRVFHNYIKNKYAGQKLDAIILFMARDFTLARELPSTLTTNLPAVFVVVNDLDVPEPPGGRPFTGIFQRFDIRGTVKFIFHLQPETHRVVVIGGSSPADRATLGHITETARSMEGVDFEFWTNQPMADLCQAAQSLTEGTVVLLATVQRDVTGQAYYTTQVARMLVPSAGVPVYVLGAGLIGSGALGGNVIDLEKLGADAGKLTLRGFAGNALGQIPVQVRSNGVPMVDWRALQRWHIKTSRLPPDCVIRYRPRSAWEDHRTLVLFVGTILIAQAMTITALLVQHSLRRQAEAEILKQQTALTHVARVSMMGQLTSALTHELNQPLGAILRNAEAAEIFLQSSPPNLDELRAILTDIRRDDKRAGNVIDRMRSLFKRQSLVCAALDLRELVEDTVAMARPDAEARHTKIKIEMPPTLPAAQGDRVHIQQVLLNLILNGMDAMRELPKNQRSLVLQLEATKNGNLQVAVSDCGSGIGPDAAEHIFEPLFTTKSNGMGMGLAISRTIIEAHGGEIWLQSRIAEGTKFTFLLPPAGFDKLKLGDLPAAG